MPDLFPDDDPQNGPPRIFVVRPTHGAEEAKPAAKDVADLIDENATRLDRRIKVAGEKYRAYYIGGLDAYRHAAALVRNLASKDDA